MLSVYHIRLLVEVCREMTSKGLLNKERVQIPPLDIDMVLAHDFLGAHHNPAIFVNSATYKQLKKFHKHWVENKTLVFRKSFLKESPIDVIGAVAHEMGHAFNVAANIPNTEVNAYIYEIEIMRLLAASHSPLLFGCTLVDVQSYFQRRLTFYEMNHQNKTLKKLVELIKDDFQLTKEGAAAPVKKENNLDFIKKGRGFFSHPIAESQGSQRQESQQMSL
jgi:hypothetical protein